MTKANRKRPRAIEVLREAGKLAATFGWPSKTFERPEDQEVVLVAKPTEASFDRFVWVYDTSGLSLRCMAAGNIAAPVRRQRAMLELCARINQGLLFGCAEYSFGDRTVVFRETVELGFAPLSHAVGATTTRVLSLAARYGEAIRQVADGKKPEIAVTEAESSND